MSDRFTDSIEPFALATQGWTIEGKIPLVSLERLGALVRSSQSSEGEDVSGTFTVSVDSADNVAVNKVELYVDNSFLEQKLSEPYDFAVDTGAMSEGTHSLSI